MILLKTSVHGMSSVSIHNPTKQVAEAVRRLVRASQIDDPDYELRSRCGAYLQADHPDWLLVEFWNGTQQDHEEFAARLNSQLQT